MCVEDSREKMNTLQICGYFLLGIVFLAEASGPPQLGINKKGPPYKNFSKTAMLSHIEQVGNTPPNLNDDFPTEISCEVFVESFDSINEVDMDFTVSVMLQMTWADYRFLDWTSFNLQKDTFLEFDSKRLDSGKMWMPDIFFPNEKNAFIHHVFMPNKMLRVYGGGRVSFTARISLTLSCPMNLRFYPFDKQTCNIEMESFGYNTDNIVLHWMRGLNKTVPYYGDDYSPVVINKDIIMNQFHVEKIVLNNITVQRKGSGTHSRLKAQFQLGRSILYYLVQMYIPSILVVMLSWISFWLNVNAVPGRISLGVMTVLTMTQQSSNFNASLPRVSYTKAIDIWMSTCLVFVFASLIEFAIANVLARKDTNKGFSFSKMIPLPRRSAKKRKRKGSGVLMDDEGVMRLDPWSDPTIVKQKKQMTGLMHATYLDISCRVLFPLSFAIFTLAYWLHYQS